ncbi:MAG: TRAP transporter large permease subunit [Chloroflexi bacterium]|nr:TRAP transporter large permease subunit [Chloroflexota bacterium]
MEWQFALAIIGVAFVILLLLGVPLAVSMGIVGAVYIITIIGPEKGLQAIGFQMMKSLNSYNLLPIIFFVVMGEFMLIGGLADDIFDFASKWLNRLPGGLSLVAIGSCTIFSTLSGSTSAATSTIGKLTIPEMLKRGYSKRLATGAVAAAGGLAHMIPPSIQLVVYATFVEVPVGRMLMAGFIPGFMLATGYSLVAITWGLMRPSDAPREAAVQWKDRFVSVKKLSAPLLLILSVMGSIFFGIATVTEASAIGAIVAFILFVVRKGFTWHGFKEPLRQSVVTSTFVVFIIIGAHLFSWVLNYFRIPHQIMGFVVSLKMEPILFIIVCMLLYLILGMFIDTMGQVFITMPVILPILDQFGYSPIWFGILFYIMVEVGMITPPYGMILYIIKGISPSNISFGDILRGAMPFFISDFTTLTLVMAFPALALWLPSLMYGSG